jgi:hypothetical protein
LDNGNNSSGEGSDDDNGCHGNNVSVAAVTAMETAMAVVAMATAMAAM